MPNIDAHKPGSFCWIELGTTDQDAAKKFYGSLFGWGANDFPMGPEGIYTIFRLQDRDAAAVYTLRAEDRAHGVPPHWMIYVAVENADVAAGRVSGIGGKVLAPAFDVMDVGRMAVVQDPTGAIFAVWQAKKHSGIGITGVPGTLCWADLSTRDQSRAQTFYSDLFGWKMIDDTDDDPPSGYVHVQNGQDFIGGILPPAYVNPHAPPHWMPYFQVANCDDSTAQAKQLGARVYMDPQTLEEVGRFAVLADPQGAAFAIFQVIPKK
ncbi:MAG: VOC family protein [Acidobacteriaceae bacterium]|nr:VOC family protein [Acidobacteriaceae bacterium]